jgi:hypothetical protein
MRKKNRNIIAGVILVVAILIILVSFGAFKLPFSVINSGFSTLSLSSINVNSNDPVLGGQTWFLTVSQNGASQSAYVDNSAVLKDDTTGATSNPMTISLTLNKNYASYNIFNQGVPIRHLEYTTTSYTAINLLTGTSGCNTAVWNNYQIFQQVSYCFNYVTDGYYGTIGQANQVFQSTVNVQGSGGSDSCTISNTGANTCYSQAGNLYASWVGSLVSGASAPDPSSQGIVAVYNTATGGWKTANQNSYQTYSQQNINSCITSGGTNCFNQYNNYESAFMNGYSFTSTGGNVAYTQGTQNSGQVILNLPQQFNFPVITMGIKASMVGINILSGKPKILSATPQVFQTGQTGTIQATVENVGTATGSFNVGATCTNGFSQTGNSLTISSLAPNSQNTVYIPITANVVSGTNEGTCTVTATDISNSLNSDTKTVSVSANAIIICTNGQISTNGNLIQQCTNNVWVTIKSCNPANETAQLTGSGASCVPKNSPGTCGFLGVGCLWNSIFGSGGFFDNLFSGIGNFFSIVKLIASILAGIFAFVFSLDLFNKISFVKNHKWLLWIISLIIGLLFFWLVTTVFWIGVILFVVYLIFKSIIGATPIGQAFKLLKK